MYVLFLVYLFTSKETFGRFEVFRVDPTRSSDPDRFLSVPHPASKRLYICAVSKKPTEVEIQVLAKFNLNSFRCHDRTFQISVLHTENVYIALSAGKV